MKLARWMGFASVLTAAVVAVASVVSLGCGKGSSHAAAHHGEAEVTPQAPPTPDTTPIEALRTPAGLVLKITPGPTK